MRLHRSMAFRFFVALLLAETTACGGGGGGTVVPTALAGAGLAPASTDRTAGCPPASPGFEPLASLTTCPSTSLFVVGGRAVAGDNRTRANQTQIALLFDAQGNFLYATDRSDAVRHGSAFELDVRTDPATAPSALVQDLWTLRLRPNNFPGFAWGLQFRAVFEASGDSVAEPSPWVPYFVYDGNGQMIYAEEVFLFPQPPFQIPPGTPRPVTVLQFVSSPAQSHCGDCFLVLFHH